MNRLHVKLAIAYLMALELFPLLAASRAETSEAVQNKLLATAQSLSRMGGLVTKEGKGNFTFFCQEGIVPNEELSRLQRLFSLQLKFPITTNCSSFAFSIDKAPSLLKGNNANLGVFVISDAQLPLSLVALEEKWAMINVAKLGDGSADAKALGNRIQRELSRVLRALIMGGTTVRGQAAVTCFNDLDLITTDPIDGKQLYTIVHSLQSFGLTPPRVVPYRRACQEGWAPAPTNDIQKAIWEKIHAAPDKPIKITYDKGRQKPVVK